MSQFPWDMVEVDTIQTVLRDLGLSPYIASSRRSKLVKLLREVEQDGLEAVIQDLEDRHRARAESPELEYLGAPPPGQRLVPYVEIASSASPRRLVQHQNAAAGPSRVRLDSNTSASATANGATGHASASASAGAARAGTKRKADQVTVELPIPPPSYAIIYKQHQEIAPPSKEPVPLRRPDLVFDGVYLPPPPRKHARREPVEAGHGHVDGDRIGDEDGDEAGEEEEEEVEDSEGKRQGQRRGRVRAEAHGRNVSAREPVSLRRTPHQREWTSEEEDGTGRHWAFGKGTETKEARGRRGSGSASTGASSTRSSASPRTRRRPAFVKARWRKAYVDSDDDE
ncbi:hypothetical protein C8Q74DRAFT_1279918 [Fomes fomentarius]|nr:hypothetical protein C8Q74DRAFT_1279918 [Fomes fomentarius]